MSPPATPRRSGAAATPHSRDATTEAAMMSCERFLNGHGPRIARDLLATIPVDTDVDYYGVGGAVSALEAKIATLLNKPAALFLPSGTMAQQIALKVHAQRRGRKSVAFHPACHLDSHEERGYELLHDLFAIPVGPRNLPLTAASLALVREPVGALLIELPQRDLGGTLPSWRELNAQVQWARDRGAAVHLDGARLWESSSYYRKSFAEIASLFDSVYVSFYKGLGGITGCCVTGEQDLIDEVSVWRTRHGGRLFGMWPYAASALSVLETRLPRMGKYYRHAVAISKALDDLPDVEVMPAIVQSSMMHVRLKVSPDELRDRALDIAQRRKVWTFARPYVEEGGSSLRIEFTVGDATLDFTPEEIRDLIDQLAHPTKRRSTKSTAR
ncbi:MAG TPA: beta-eliminating lyase-related protein [Acidimicrobiales bacterium]|nr:beta-eliminating lyase-related protein [Acidimicrobiales bacterium]